MRRARCKPIAVLALQRSALTEFSVFAMLLLEIPSLKPQAQ
jgi:hypothetical protein